MEDLCKKEITELAENFKVFELINKIPDRLKLEERLKTFENLDNYTLKRIRKIYLDVIPEISTCNLNLPIPEKISKYILDFRIVTL